MPASPRAAMRPSSARTSDGRSGSPQRPATSGGDTYELMRFQKVEVAVATQLAVASQMLDEQQAVVAALQEQVGALGTQSAWQREALRVILALKEPGLSREQLIVLNRRKPAAADGGSAFPEVGSPLSAMSRSTTRPASAREPWAVTGVVPSPPSRPASARVAPPSPRRPSLQYATEVVTPARRHYPAWSELS